MKEEIRKLAVFSKEKYREQLEYWQGIISPELKPVNLPVDFSPHNQQERSIDSININFPTELVSKPGAPGKQSDMALFVVLLAAFKVFLSRCTGSEETLIAAPLLKLDNKALTGYHYNTRILFRDWPDTALTFKELLLDTKNKTLQAYKNQNYPLDMVFKKSGLRMENYSFLDRIIFSLKNIHEENQVMDLNYDLLFSFSREGQLISGEIFFNGNLFKKETIEQFGSRYIKILAAAVNDFDIVIRDFNVLSTGELEQLLYEFNRTQWEYPASKTTAGLFQEQAAREPDRTALVENHGTGWITYKELNERSNQLASFLRKKSAGADNIVALMMEPSADMIIAILGILKAGKAYLPMDAAFPAERIRSILEDSSASILLTKEELIRQHSFRSLQGADESDAIVVGTPSRSPVDQLDTLQIPDRSYINYEKYSPYIGQSMIKGSITFQFSRGCRFNCAYCFKIWSNRYVHRSAQNMFDELLLYYKLGVRKFSFVDDLPNFNIEESAKFYQLIIKNRLNLRLFYPNGLRGDILTKDYIDLMVEAGAISLDVALETTSHRLQKLIGKHLDLEKLDENIRYMIDKYPQLILETQLLHGIPTETEEEARASLDYLESLKWVHMPYLHVLKIYPGTAMARLAMKHGISRQAIERSDSLGYNELPETLPFPKSFTHKYQSEFASEYFMSKERLLAVLPYQMKALTEDELVQKYNSFLPVNINCFSDLLNYVGIEPGELDAEFLPDDYGRVPDINKKIKGLFPRENPRADALKVLLIDVSAYFTHDRHGVIYDVVEPSLGLMYVQTHLDRTFESRVHGKIVSSRIDFDNFAGLRTIINDFKPDVIGIRTLNFYKDFFHKTVSFIRQWGIDVPIIAGGPYATSSYQTLLRDIDIDLVVLGEGEITFAEIIGKIIENKGILPAEDVLRKIPGIAFVEGKEKLRQKKGRREILLWDQLAQTLTGESSQNPEPVNKPADMAYVIYTSGSTGLPKGVIIQQNNLVNQLTGLVRTFNFNDTHHYILLAAFVFDVSIMHIFLPLITGAKLFLISDQAKKDPLQLWQFIDEKQVNILNIVPAFMKALLENIEKKKIHLDYLFVGGEVFDQELYHMLKETFVIGTTINIYGPTETTINALVFRCEGSEELMVETIPIGKPLLNYRVYILDRDLNPVPIGIAGELCIGGQGLARGYLNRPALTFEKFDHDLWDYRDYQDKRKKIPGKDHIQSCNHASRQYHSPSSHHPNPPSPHHRIYMTGDLARWLHHGNVEFLGRIDTQVKVRGYRIELGEIEDCLLKHESIKDAVVICRNTGNGDNYLCAYIVSNNGLPVPALKEYLLKHLPRYEVPSHFVRLEKMPVTTTGKVDKKGLPEPGLQGVDEYKAPRNVIEKKLVNLWSNVLNMEKNVISIDSNFFHLGGHSLKATILVSKIHKVFDVKVPMTEVFKTPRIRELAEYIKGKSHESYISIEPVEEKEYYTLAPAQKRLYILQQLVTDNTGYNMPYVIPLGEGIAAGELEFLFKGLIKRHESLRTTFIKVKEQPVQRIYPRVDFSIGYYELAQEIEAVPLISGFTRPFDLSRAPLIRVNLVTIASSRRLLFIDMHHIITDGTSQMILEKEFAAMDSGEVLPPLRLQYKDYSEWYNSAPQQAAIKQQESYWLKEFPGETPVLNLPTDFPRPLLQGVEGNVVSFLLSTAETAAVKSIIKENDVTLYMGLLSVFTILLAKLSGQEDIIIGTPIAARHHADLQKVIGMLVNTLAMRNYPVGEKSFKAFLKEVKQRTLAAYENQGYPFEVLVDKITVNRDTGRNPIFDVMFNLLNQADYRADTSRMNDRDSYTHIKGTSKFDLNLSAIDLGERIHLRLEYSTKLFKPARIGKMIGYFKKILQVLSADTGLRLLEIEIMAEEEKEQVLYGFNDTKVDYPEDKTIHELFEEQAEKMSDHIAAVSPVQISYGELQQKSDRLACILKEKGIKPDMIVGIKVERSLAMIIGILGILKAEGAYLPIEPHYPEERIDYMLKDSGAKILLKCNDLTPEVFNICPMGASPHLHLSPAPNTSLAYIIYTSGSTGNPKGVMVEHGSVVNLLYALQKEYPCGEKDTYLLKTSYIFDVSVTELFAWYMGGGRVAVLERDGHKDPRAIMDSIERNKLTHINFVPSAFNAFIDYISMEGNYRLSGLKYIFLAGEALLPELVEKFRQINTDITLENIYGPTEGTVYASKYSLSHWERAGSIPIGKPLPNIKLYILNKHHYLQPPGVVGELCISGPGLARGYLNHPELTIKNFCLRRPGGALFVKTAPPGPPRKNFLLMGPGKKYHRSYPSHMSYIYLSGDLARWLHDGNIEFLGRIDTQVKIRGFRIELGEIENRLSAHPQVKEAVVVGQEELDGNIHLYAYVVSPVSLVISDLKFYLAKVLPDYMIPAYFVQLEKIPVTPNGKVDRKLLPKREIKPGKEHRPPKNKIEKKLLEIWAGVLGIDHELIGIDSGFFLLGGDSLTAVTVLSRIHKVFNVKFSLADLFKKQTVKELARAVEETVGIEYSSRLIPVEKKQYYPVSSAQKRVYVIQQMEKNSTAYNVPQMHVLEGPVQLLELEKSAGELIRRHESLRTSFHILENQPVQRIHDGVEFAVHHHSAEERDAKKWAENFIQPFDLGHAPCFKLGLIKLGKNKHIILIDMHHIITDGISNAIFIKEFVLLYTGQELPCLRLQYKDFSHWHNQRLDAGEMNSRENYWLKLFQGNIPELDFPTDFDRPLQQSFAGARLVVPLGIAETAAVMEYALNRGVTLFMVLLTVFYVLLAKLTGQEDIVVGTALSGRRHADLEYVIGMFINSLALRNYPSGRKTFNSFLLEVKKGNIEAFDNQDYPLEELVTRLAVNRTPGRNPLFDVIFALDSTRMHHNQNPGHAGETTGILIKPYIHEKINSKVDMTFTIMERGNNLYINVVYCTALFKETTIQRIVNYYINILKDIPGIDGKKLSRIEIKSQEEREPVETNRDNTGNLAADFDL